MKIKDYETPSGNNYPAMVQIIIAILIAISISFDTHADVRLPNIFGDDMVLQQEKPMVFWGWAQPKEVVTVKIANESGQAEANDQGEWKVTLPPMSAGGPYYISVMGSSVIYIHNVMIGEVWLCSGQSNMEMGVGVVTNSAEEVADANQPGIRWISVSRRWASQPVDNITGNWKVCSSKTVTEGGWGGLSATAYFFARDLHKKLGVTIGLITSAWGGTRIEPWTAPEGFASVPALNSIYHAVQMSDPRSKPHQACLAETLGKIESWVSVAKQALDEQQIVPPMPDYPSELLPMNDRQSPTVLFNGMIHPLCPFALRGIIWYQGESNNGDGMMYFEKMKALINGWRDAWGDDDLSFYFVQIAPFDYPASPYTTPELWEAQTAAQAIPHTGMVVINDVGDVNNIHFKNKKPVGHRLALWALSHDYGFTNLVYSGPTFKSMTVRGDKMYITFDHVGGGLVSQNGKPLTWFELIDADEGGFVSANAKIEGSTVVLSASQVKHPVAMRFAWSSVAQPNLMNKEGLPAGAFRAGVVPNHDLLAMKVPEAKDYQLVYDLDLFRLGQDFTYDVDNRSKIVRPFDRIAYFLELQNDSKDIHYIYVSMDAFTTDPSKIGIPMFESGAYFQQNVTNMNVVSNVKGIITGHGLTGGNIEFWPDTYEPVNGSSVPIAPSFGDKPVPPVDGYGCMQVHNHEARQTLFSINDWDAAENADIGIGNNPEGRPDWTFSHNAKEYKIKRLRVLVHYKQVLSVQEGH